VITTHRFSGDKVQKVTDRTHRTANFYKMKFYIAMSYKNNISIYSYYYIYLLSIFNSS